MVERVSYPQIPSTVWWGVRNLFHRSPNARVDEHFLSADLGVQDTASKQYIAELRRVGLITDEGRATAIAGKWRLDDSYTEAVEEILESKYPEGLRQLGNPGEVDRQKVTSWFMSQGLGAGAAKNKASTYYLIGSPNPNSAPTKGVDGEPDRKTPERPKSGSRGTAVPSKQPRVEKIKSGEQSLKGTDHPALNINLQIHIGADASPDQINSIFSAMRRYLYEGS